MAKEAGRKTESPSAKSTSSEGRKSQGEDRQAGSPNKDSSNAKSSFRTPPPKDIPPLVPVTPKSDGNKTPVSSGTEGRNSSKPSASSPSASTGTVPSSSSSGQSSNSRISLNCGSLSLEVNHQESTSHALNRTSLPPSLHAAAKHDSLGAHSLLSHSAYAGLPFLGHPGLDPAHYSSLAAHSALLAAAHHKPGGMSPYVKYATVKTASGATTLVPVCSDPYCTHCKLTMSSAQLSPPTGSSSACGAGCTECTHGKQLPPHPPSSLSLSSLPHSALSSSAAALSSLYPHQPFGVLPGHHGLPYICNWVAGSDYCGKRFATSEELLQHLRSHTSSGDASAAAAAAAAFSPYSSLGLSASLAAAHSHFPSTPGSLSPNSSLRQAAAAAAAYPRSLSPNSVLAAARYHPYSKSASASSSLLPPTAPPSLGAYYPYAAAAALYSQRLGAVP